MGKFVKNCQNQLGTTFFRQKRRNLVLNNTTDNFFKRPVNFSLHEIHYSLGNWYLPFKVTRFGSSPQFRSVCGQNGPLFCSRLYRSKKKEKKKITYHYGRNFEILSQNFEVFSILNKVKYVSIRKKC